MKNAEMRMSFCIYYSKVFCDYFSFFMFRCQKGLRPLSTQPFFIKTYSVYLAFCNYAFFLRTTTAAAEITARIAKTAIPTSPVGGLTSGALEEESAGLEEEAAVELPAAAELEAGGATELETGGATELDTGGGGTILSTLTITGPSA